MLLDCPLTKPNSLILCFPVCVFLDCEVGHCYIVGYDFRTGALLSVRLPPQLSGQHMVTNYDDR